ncbi:TIGR02391 family protein [Rubrivirga sp. IMCC43871]|uniref:TIGR02391 family protein n=1 Tax=Rubrivirga sp. IMCC43871 TaxID=3391575 RepID=UPI003990268B
MSLNKPEAVEKLKQRADQARLMLRETTSIDFAKWRRDTAVAIKYIFGQDSGHLKEFESTQYSLRRRGSVVYHDGTPSPRPSAQQQQAAKHSGVRSAIALIESMIDEVNEYWPDVQRDPVGELNFWPMLHPVARTVSKSRFEAGHYADSVEAVLKELECRVRDKAGGEIGDGLSGARLMQHVFSLDNHVLRLGDTSTESGKNTQKGYMQIFAGVMTGVRNPKAHANLEIGHEDAVHLLFLGSLLMHMVDNSEHAQAA